MQKSILDKIQN